MTRALGWSLAPLVQNLYGVLLAVHSCAATGQKSWQTYVDIHSTCNGVEQAKSRSLLTKDQVEQLGGVL
eukprot:scaffold184292_cov18-Tisochrysis_lutea.AAC.2